MSYQPQANSPERNIPLAQMLAYVCKISYKIIYSHFPFSAEVGLPPDSDLYNYHDSEFLRAIYSAVAFSSLILVWEHSLGRFSHRRVPLYKLLEVSHLYINGVAYLSVDESTITGMHLQNNKV